MGQGVLGFSVLLKDASVIFLIMVAFAFVDQKHFHRTYSQIFLTTDKELGKCCSVWIKKVNNHPTSLNQFYLSY